MGIARAVHSTVYDALYSMHLDKNSEGSEWGAWEALNYFTEAVGALIGSWIVVKLGFGNMFVIMAVMVAISGIYLARLPKRTL